MLIKITDNIDINEACTYLSHDGAGAVNIFLGTVRDNSRGKKVNKLEFEAYTPMALKEMQKVADKAAAKWQLFNIAIVHVIGTKQPGEAVVLTGVSSAHRDVSFEACRYLIDELKKTVPIWKKEYYNDDSVWINANP